LPKFWINKIEVLLWTHNLTLQIIKTKREEERWEWGSCSNPG